MIYQFLRFTQQELSTIYTNINSFLCDTLYTEQGKAKNQKFGQYKEELDKKIKHYEGILQRIINETKERHENRKFKFIIYFKARRSHDTKSFNQFCFVEATTMYNAQMIAWEQHTQIDKFWAFEIIDCITLSSISQINTEMLDELMEMKYKEDSNNG